MSTQAELRAQVEARLTELDILPNKKLGQNFLISPMVIERIVKRVGDLAPEAVIEVGPGLGALTEPLAELGLPLTLIELDRTLAEFWVVRGLQVVRDDALQIDWSQLLSHDNVCLVSNLPYQISSSLVIDRCLGPIALNSMVLMFQKEVAQRIQAAPRSKIYGLLSVMAQSFWRVETVVDAAPGAFLPPPQIASRVLQFRRIESPVVDKKGYLAFVKSGFAQRRKQVGKALIAYAKMRYRLSSEQTLEILLRHQLQPTQRAEEITVEQWQKVFLDLDGNNGNQSHQRKQEGPI